MMTGAEANNHLNEDQLICSVVDENDLSLNVRAHLTGCSACVAAKRNMEDKLGRLDNFAREFSPRVQRRIRIAEFAGRRAQPSWWNRHRRSILAAGFGVAAVVMLLTSLVPLNDRPETSLAQLEREMREDEQLLESVDRLEENALPTFYVDVAEASDMDFYEDFMDFVAPDEQNKSSTLMIRKRGRLCGNGICV